MLRTLYGSQCVSSTTATPTMYDALRVDAYYRNLSQQISYDYMPLRIMVICIQVSYVLLLASIWYSKLTFASGCLLQ
jgi:hypothetical protein